MSDEAVTQQLLSESSVSKGSTGYVFRLTMVAALGGLLFGYDTAVISGAIGFLQRRFDLNAVMMGGRHQAR